VVDLPQPLSPTRPSVSPLSSDSVMPCSAETVPLRVRNSS
jgi:hypothetical protein